MVTFILRSSISSFTVAFHTRVSNIWPGGHNWLTKGSSLTINYVCISFIDKNVNLPQLNPASLHSHRSWLDEFHLLPSRWWWFPVPDFCKQHGLKMPFFQPPLLRCTNHRFALLRDSVWILCFRVMSDIANWTLPVTSFNLLLCK